MATIVLYERVPQAWFDDLAEFLRERQPEEYRLELAQCEDADLEGKLVLLHKADVLLVGLTGQRRPLGREVLEQAPRLRLIQKLGSRAAGVDVEAARQAGVAVSLLPSPHHVACAEHTLLLLLALARKLIPTHQRVVRKQAKETGPLASSRCPEPRRTSASDYAYNWAALDGIGLVAGKTLGLIGMADIAVEAARRARAFGLKLLYYDQQPLPAEEERELGLERRELDDLLREADIVSLHVALTPETENLLSVERLARMKPTAFLVNTARGGLVDEAALAAALSEGRLAGAALDAWAVEPTPKDNPLLKLESVVATPHVAAGTLPTTALFEAVLPNLLAALRGQPIAGSLTPDLAPRPPLEPEPREEELPREEEPAPEQAPPAETPQDEAETADDEPPPPQKPSDEAETEDWEPPT